MGFNIKKTLLNRYTSVLIRLSITCWNWTCNWGEIGFSGKWREILTRVTWAFHVLQHGYWFADALCFRNQDCLVFANMLSKEACRLEVKCFQTGDWKDLYKMLLLYSVLASMDPGGPDSWPLCSLQEQGTRRGQGEDVRVPRPGVWSEIVFLMGI